MLWSPVIELYEITSREDGTQNPCFTSVGFTSFAQEGKGKAISLQAWTGPEGSRKLRLPDFKTIGT